MDQLICHLLGDFVLQTDWMARKKAVDISAAIIHSFVYAIPFTLITGLSWALAVIFVTHIFIDHYQLAVYIMRLKQWSWRSAGQNDSAPPEVKTILIIVIDNTMHLAINFLAIKYLS